MITVGLVAAGVSAEPVILENALTRIEIDPQAGGKITHWLDKQTGLDYASNSGLRDITAGVHALAHQVQRQDGEGFQGVVARVRHENLAIERQMRLAHDSKELSVSITCTNLGAQPRNVWLRWHPYLEFKDDPYAEHSVILVPGPGTQVRRIAVGSGQDAWFWQVPGYWMAINSQTGNGVWMTFRKQQVPTCSTWTHYGFDKTRKRSMFTMESFPKTVLLHPGQSTQLEMTHALFTASDELGRGLIADEDLSAAQRFARLVRQNASVIGRHSMVPGPRQGSAIAQNRFNFHHRRRDRFALLDHAIVDAMFALPGDQKVPVRCRLYAHLFNSEYDYHAFRYRLTVANAIGEVVRDRTWTYGGAALDSRLFDMREDVAIDDLPDGWYTFKLQAFAGSDVTAGHEYERRGRLSGQARAQATADRKVLTARQRERAFVTDLRTVALPDDASVLIGFEEPAGVARSQWPLRLGVPFPQGQVMPGTGFTVFDGDQPSPTQTRAIGSWPDGSVRWLLVDFLADLEPRSHRFVRLRPDAAKSLPNLAQTRGDDILIDTAAAQWRVLPNGAVANLLQPSDAWWTTGQGVEYRLKNTVATLQENGPVRARVRIVGDYLSDSAEQPIARGQIDLEFHRGQPHVQLAHTVTYIGDPLENTLGSAGIVLRPQPANWTGAAVDVGDALVNSDAELAVHQIDDDFVRVINAQGARQERARSSGAALLVGSNQRYLALHQDFWRLYPSRVDVSTRRGCITFHYWPQDAGAMSWLPREGGQLSSSSSPHAMATGVSRTHRFVVDPTGRFEPVDAEKVFNEPIACLTPPRYLAATAALLHLQPYNPDVAPELENFIAEAMESYQLHQRVYGWYGQWRWGAVDNQFDHDREAWAEYGRYANLMNEQDIVHLPWLAYLRSGERDYLKFALANTRHLLEVGTIRENPRDPQQAGMSRRHHECVWLAEADYGHSMIDPFLELYHATGDVAGWEAAQRMADGMARATAGSFRYISNPLAGLSRLYLETGEPIYKQHADRLWNDLCNPDRNAWFQDDHGARAAILYSQINHDCRRIWQEMTDAGKAFQTLDALAALWEQTGDAAYAQEAARQFKLRVERAQSFDKQRTDPMFWSAAMHTQHVLAAMREMVYASSAVEASLR